MRRRRSRVLLPLLASIIAIGVLFVGVFPTRALLAQRQDIARSQHRLHVLEQENDVMKTRIDALGTDAEIERIAREQYDLVRPGDEAYAILPAPEQPDP